MQRFFVIPPLKHLDLMEYNACKAGYCLAHFCLKQHNPDYELYKQFFVEKKKQGWTIILDNSAAEDNLVNADTLLRLVDELKPTFVVAPDVLFNCGETLSNLKIFCNRMNLAGLSRHTSVLGCPQGDSPESYLHCYLSMLDNENVKMIGLSKLAVPKSFCKITDSNSVSTNRRYLVKILNELQLLQKPIHCLGMRSITEYKAYKNISAITSTDSCYTVLAACEGISLEVDNISDLISNTPQEYFEANLSAEQLILAKHNIDELKKSVL